MKTLKHIRNLAITALISLAIFHWPYVRALARKAAGQEESCPWGKLAIVPLSALHGEYLIQRYTLQVKPLEYDASLGIQKFQSPTRAFWIRKEGRAKDGKALLAFLLAEQHWIMASAAERGVQRGDVVVDIGAHIGTFGDDALRHGVSKVIMVEPDPVNVECLRRNFRTEIAEGRVVVVPEGAWSTHSKLEFSAGVLNSGTGSFVLREESGRKVQVIVRPLDEMLRELGVAKVDFIKIDIEGGEREALRGAWQTLKTYKPRLMLDAYHLPDDSVVLPRLIHEANAGYRSFCPVCSVSAHSGVIPHALFFQ